LSSNADELVAWRNLIVERVDMCCREAVVNAAVCETWRCCWSMSPTVAWMSCSFPLLRFVMVYFSIFCGWFCGSVLFLSLSVVYCSWMSEAPVSLWECIVMWCCYSDTVASLSPSLESGHTICSFKHSVSLKVGVHLWRFLSVMLQWVLLCCCAVKNQKELNPVVDQVLKQEMQPLFGTDNATILNSEFLARNSSSLPHIVAGSNLTSK